MALIFIDHTSSEIGDVISVDVIQTLSILPPFEICEPDVVCVQGYYSY